MTRTTRFRRALDADLIGGAMVAVAAVVILVGCGPAPAASKQATSTERTSPRTSTSVADDSPCGLLDGATVLDLVGIELDGTEASISGSDVSACQYGTSERGLQVGRMPAEAWAESLPGVVAALRNGSQGAVDPKILAQLEEASGLLVQGAEIPSDEACSYFSRLVEANGYPPGTATSVTYLPDAESAVAISGQQCVDGVYTTLLVARPDAADSPILVDKIHAVLAGL